MTTAITESLEKKPTPFRPSIPGAILNVMEMSEERATPLDYVLIGDPEDEAYIACQEIMLRHDGKTALELYTSAATIFQTFYRRFQARQVLRRLQALRAIENAAAQIIQQAYRVRQLRHHFGPFLTHFSAPPHPTRVVCYALLGARADWVLIGVWNPMLWPIWGFRHMCSANSISISNGSTEPRSLSLERCARLRI